MTFVHRQGDQRACGATTIVTGQDFVFVDSQLWAVDKDQDTHGGGALNATCQYITINNKKVVLQNDTASPDDGGLGAHANPIATGFSNLVNVQ